MTSFEFTLIVERAFTDDEVDALFELDSGDSTPESGGRGPDLVHVRRDAPSMSEAIADAVHDVESVGVAVTGVQSDDLLSAKDIAARVGRTYESVRKWAAGERGPGGFPRPLASGQWALYSWTAVVDWLRRHDIAGAADISEHDRKIALADQVLRARHQSRDVHERSEMAGLLTA